MAVRNLISLPPPSGKFMHTRFPFVELDRQVCLQLKLEISMSSTCGYLVQNNAFARFSRNICFIFEHMLSSKGLMFYGIPALMLAVVLHTHSVCSVCAVCTYCIYSLNLDHLLYGTQCLNKQCVSVCFHSNFHSF